MAGVEGIEIKLSIAKPGDKTRITHVMDSAKPVYKLNGPTFPGLVDASEKVGEGETLTLDGIAVVQTGSYPGVMEGIIDMHGEGSKYSYFSNTVNLVVEMNVIDEMSSETFAKLSKEIVLKTAKLVALAACDQEPTSVQTFEKNQNVDGLKKVGYVCYMESLGLFRNVYLYGKDTTDIRPKVVHPNEIIDGALVSGNFEIAAHKNPTYFHQTNPIITELCKRDGKELSFEGVILSTERGVLEIKESYAKEIALFAQEMNLDGVIISKEGGGHADADLMLCVKELQERGIDTVITLNEIGGPNGDLPPIVSATPEADAVISNGNNDELITFDSVETVLGGEMINGSIDAKTSFESSVGLVYCSTNQLGVNTMAIKEY